jgi:alkylation response protein AidB-like acyl-CoA dehydrogenase
MAAAHNVETDAAHAITGTGAVVEAEPELFAIGNRYLGRQIANIGGGTTEMARNVIGERVLTFRASMPLTAVCPSTRCGATENGARSE